MDAAVLSGLRGDDFISELASSACRRRQRLMESPRFTKAPCTIITAALSSTYIAVGRHNDNV